MDTQIELQLQPMGKQEDQEQQQDVETQMETPPPPPQANLPPSSSSNSINEFVAVSSPLLPAAPPQSPHSATYRKLFQDSAAIHGALESKALLEDELWHISKSQQAQPAQTGGLRSPSSTLEASVSRNPSTSGGRHEKKLGHRRVVEGGEVTYKKIQSKQIMGSIQLGIQQTVGSLASKPKRDLLMNDFWEMESISFPPDGSSFTPAHHYSDFRFKVYAPIAFRYFRDLFGIEPDDFLMSMCASPLRELSNPGASGSIFYLTDDDEFIIKTVQKKECEFLQKLLPGYYMNLSQNPRTLLPKFFGLFCFNYNSKNVRLVAMNNLLPSDIKMHAKYDLKGSTFRRKASKAERQKASPTFKDLDFVEMYPNGIYLETDTHAALMKTIQRDCMVLESFQIMDYSLLLGIHNLDVAAKEKREERILNARERHNKDVADDAPEADQINSLPPLSSSAVGSSIPAIAGLIAGASSTSGAALNRTRSMNRQRLVAHSTAMESITANKDTTIEEDEDVPAGGIPARTEDDQRLILYIGIIDILQSYRLEKKLEHTFKSILYNGDTVSVCRPSFYAKRFQDAMAKVFRKTPTFPLKHSPSKRKASTAQSQSQLASTQLRTPQQRPSQNLTPLQRPPPMTLTMLSGMSGMSTPPPAFDDISEEDITAVSSTTQRISQQNNNNNSLGSSYNNSQSRSRISGGGGGGGGDVGRAYTPQYSYPSSALTSDYSDDESTSPYRARSPLPRMPRLTKTSVQVTTVGCVEQEQENDEQEEEEAMLDGEADDEKEREKELGQVLVNGKAPMISSTKTTVIKAVTATRESYTSTLVLSDPPYGC